MLRPQESLRFRAELSSSFHHHIHVRSIVNLPFKLHHLVCHLLCLLSECHDLHLWCNSLLLGRHIWLLPGYHRLLLSWNWLLLGWLGLLLGWRWLLRGWHRLLLGWHWLLLGWLGLLLGWRWLLLGWHRLLLGRGHRLCLRSWSHLLLLLRHFRLLIRSRLLCGRRKSFRLGNQLIDGCSSFGSCLLFHCKFEGYRILLGVRTGSILNLVLMTENEASRRSKNNSVICS